MDQSPTKIDIRGLTYPELHDWIVSLGVEPFRARQIYRWLATEGITSFEQMTNITKDLRQRMDAVSYLSRLSTVEIQVSRDGTRKFSFELEDGKRIESVLIPEKDHSTLCISSQVGCAMNCRFCLTGRGGFQRNLRASEIINQVLAVRLHLLPEERLTNLVYMGMGEPLANYENVLKSLRILMSDEGLGFSSRKVTVSTCGLVPQMNRLGRDITVNLAISLHAPDDKIRSFLMPVNNKYPLEELMDACRHFPLPPRRMITFEYLLIENVNDQPEQAVVLCRLLKNIRAKVNLIPFNSYPGSEFRSPPMERILAFQSVLVKHRLTAIIRHSKGADILAACGQLNAHAP